MPNHHDKLYAQHSTVDIRVATEDDLPAVTALQSQSTRSSLEAAIPIFRRMTSYPNYKIYIAQVCAQTVGTFTLLVMDNLGHGGAPIAIIENVVVDEFHRRSGIGRRLMEYAIHVSQKHGCYKVILASNIKLTNAHAFYEALGFKVQGYAFALEL